MYILYFIHICPSCNLLSPWITLIDSLSLLMNPPSVDSRLLSYFWFLFVSFFSRYFVLVSKWLHEIT